MAKISHSNALPPIGEALRVVAPPVARAIEEEARMADSDQILQLGIEEARNGNREAARNLFELLTRQEPDNAQAWLWLAGVADGTDQRREALQRVMALEPDNEMARKGLQAMGAPLSPASAPAAVSVSDLEPETVLPSEPERPRSADEAFADELDLAFDEDYASIPRAEAPPRRDDELGEGAIDPATGLPEAGARRSSADRPTLRRPSPRVRVADPDDDDEPVRRGPNPLLWALLALIGVLLLGIILWNLLFPGDGGTATLPTPAPITQMTATPIDGALPTALPVDGTLPTTPPADGTQPTTPPTDGTQPTAPPTDGAQPTAPPTDGTQPTAPPTDGTQPTAAPTGPPPEQANPAPVGVGTTLQASGWSYTYPNDSYVAVLGKQAGGQTSQGTFVHVLAWVSNGTGTDQRLPADFFVIKDGQGRVYTANAQLSSALVQRGVNADIGMEDSVPANGVTTSVYLVFDIQPGATDLTLFARSNPAQGFRLNIAVP
jgi:hypothetical protein